MRKKKKKKKRHQDSDNDSCELSHKRSEKERESHKPKYNIKESTYNNGFHPEKHWRSDWNDDRKDYLLPSYYTSLPNDSAHHQFNGHMGKACHLCLKSSSISNKML